MKNYLFIIPACALGAMPICAFAIYEIGSGQVVDCDYRPVSDVTVHVEHPNGSVSNYVQTDGDGLFSVPCETGEDKLVFAKYGTNVRVVYTCFEGIHVKFCCEPCTDCFSDSVWSSAGTGARKKTTKTCNCDGTCDSETDYECYGGYYGHPSASSPYCTACPYPGTSNIGTGGITRCYIPSGRSGTDASGSFDYVGNCSYVN